MTHNPFDLLEKDGRRKDQTHPFLCSKVCGVHVSKKQSSLESMNDGGPPKTAKRPRIDATNAASSAEEGAESPPGATCADPAASSSQEPAPGTTNFCDLLTNELVARVLGFLGVRDVLRARVCRSLKAASKLVTLNEGLTVRSEPLASNLAKFGRDVLPKVEEVLAVVDSSSSFDFDQLRSLEHLKRLEVRLPPRHPRMMMFDLPTFARGFETIFHLDRLERLVIRSTTGHVVLPFNMTHIARLTKLRELRLDSIICNGDLSSLAGLEKLEYLRLNALGNRGNLVSLANLESLSLLNLQNCSFEGDIRDIQPHQFPSLKILKIIDTCIYGRPGTKFMSIDDASVFFGAWSRVLSHSRPMATIQGGGKLPWAVLDKSSAEYYEAGRWTVFARHPPFIATMIRVGQRLGYRWRNQSGQACDICWLDPEPSSDDADYDAYWASLYQLERKHRHSIYRGYIRPPTREEWQQIARA